MRKSKMMKALLVFGMSVVTATAMVGITACDNGSTGGGGEGGGEQTGHTHVWDYEQLNDTQHKKTCTADGHVGDPITENHTKVNNECPDCGYKFTTGGEEVEDTEPYITISADDVFENLTETQTISSEKDLGNGFKILAASNATVTVVPYDSGSEKTIIYSGKEITVNSSIRLGGTGKSGSRVIKMDLQNNAKLIVYSLSGSAGSERSLQLYNSGFAAVGSPQSVYEGNYIATNIFDVTNAGTYYLGSTNSGINILYMAVVYGTINETVGRQTAAVDATCENVGHVAYYQSSYGRYYADNAKTTLLDTGAKLVKPALSHEYTTVSSATADYPTQEQGGTAYAVCSRDPEHKKEIKLPALTDENYGRTPATEANKTVYSWLDNATGVTVTFTTDSVEEVTVQKTTYTADFSSMEADASLASDSLEGLKQIGTTGIYTTKCGSSGKVTAIAQQSIVNEAGDNTVKVMAYCTQGAATTAQNSLVVSCGAGTTTITIKYFSSNADRYIKVMNAAGESLTDSSSNKTTMQQIGDKKGGDLKEATLTITLEEAGYIYIGSASSGIYISYLQVVTPTVAQD